MKKKFFLYFLILGTLVGCSNEDSAPLTATPLEG